MGLLLSSDLASTLVGECAKSGGGYTGGGGVIDPPFWACGDVFEGPEQMGVNLFLARPAKMNYKN